VVINVLFFKLNKKGLNHHS